MGAIRFPHLGLEFRLSNGFHIGNFEIRFYGIIIAIGLICGALYVYREAKRTGQKVDDFIDYTFFAVIGAIICARIYYVVFEWDYYSKHVKEIFDIRGGGIAIYGAVIGGAIALIIFSKVKKLSFFKMADTIMPGLLIGQIIGRWGNFFNREAFGRYTDNLLAMQIPLTDVSVGTITDDMLVNVGGIRYVQVHPTFLYESMLNLVLLILIIIFKDKKKFNGETLCRYCAGYGIIRFFVEGLRTDQLKLSNGMAVSRIVSVVIAVIGLFFIVYMRIRLRGKAIPAAAGTAGDIATDDDNTDFTEEADDSETDDLEADDTVENEDEELKDSGDE